MNNEQENLLQFIRGMARSARVVVPAVPYHITQPCRMGNFYPPQADVAHAGKITLLQTRPHILSVTL